MTIQKLPIDSLIEAFYGHLQNSGKSESTCKNYRTDLYCLREYLASTPKNDDLSNFNIPMAKEFAEFLAKKYTSDNSIRRRIQSARLFFDYLIFSGHFSFNPIKAIPSAPKFLDIPHPTSMKDVAQIFDYFQNFKGQNELEDLINQRNLIIFILIFLGGQKVSDIETMSVKQVQVLEREIRVLIISVKKRDPFTVPLPISVAKYFNKYIENLNLRKFKDHIESEHLLFSANPFRMIAGGITARGIEIVFEDIRKKLKIETFTPKSLRQAGIFVWLQQDFSDSTIKEWMGVAPQYSMKLYRDHMQEHQYSLDIFK